MQRGLVTLHGILTEILEYLRPHRVDLGETVDPALKDHSNDRKPDGRAGIVKRRFWPPVAGGRATPAVDPTRRSAAAGIGAPSRGD
jgi:hypothetical protein